MVRMLAESKWTIYVLGHAEAGEVSTDGARDAFELSSKRASEVARSLIKRGIAPNRVVTSFFGDTRPIKVTGSKSVKKKGEDRRVEFMIRKRDLQDTGNKVDAR